MIEWLQSIGLSLTSEYGYIVYTTACVLAVIVVSSVKKDRRVVSVFTTYVMGRCM